MLASQLTEERSVTGRVQSRTTTDLEEAITPTQLLLAFAGLFLLNLLLRVFYIRYDFVNGDEGVRALTAVRMLEGARLYADVVTDKPPGASLFYAAIFVVFGRSMKAVHLVAIVWNFATGVFVYLTAARFYTRRLGLWAALLFVYFSTNYFTQDTMAANTELLMALPYTAAFYVFMRGRRLDSGNVEPEAGEVSIIALFGAGLLTAMAALFKQIGVLNLGFFAMYEVLSLWRVRERISWALIRRAILRMMVVGSGFVLIIAAFVLWLKSLNALEDFWRNAVVLNMFYIDSEPAGLWFKFMSSRGASFILFNAVLWVLAGWALWRSIRSNGYEARGSGQSAQMDRALTLWAAVTLAAVMISGRFYGHYFIPALPALSVLAARGAGLLSIALRDPARRRKARVGLAILSVFFIVGLIRSHHRTSVLAYETITGTRTHWSENWGMTKREQEAEVVSKFVRDIIPPGEALYIWGYAHDVFWRTGCRPASRYLTPYFIDGRFADTEATVSSSGEQFRREAAANLLEDLRQSRPRLILDGEGGFRALPYAELVDFVNENYRDEGTIGSDRSHLFRIWQLEEDKRQKQ
jgi:4-amino-4-deoxy-L-arabinose transferase-like glycosyltransferase